MHDILQRDVAGNPVNWRRFEQNISNLRQSDDADENPVKSYHLGALSGTLIPTYVNPSRNTALSGRRALRELSLSTALRL